MSGKDQAPSYETFDSSEFEEAPSQAAATETETKDEGDSKDVKAEVEGEQDKLTPEDAFGDDGESDEKEAKPEGEVTDDADKKDPAADAAAEAAQPEGTPAYEPNLKYRVYDQEKDFPEQIKSVVKDKASEDYFRDLLSKADGLDEMKPRHQETVRERDLLKADFDRLNGDVNRIINLRDNQPHVFANEIGLSDDWILKRAKEIVNAKETPEAWSAFDGQRQRELELYNQNVETARQADQVRQSGNSLHQQAFQMALSHPEISDFERRFDAHYGTPGAFREEVRKHGFYHFEQSKAQTGKGVNLPPMDAMRAVMQFHQKTFAPPAAVTQPAPTPKAQPTPPNQPRVRAQPIPNVGGKGKNVSPVGQRFKSVKEMRAYVDKHIP